ncbi:hypothetical protein [Mesorhizobium sp. Z1-4]|uniref:hypothetical protein n=1 Tax=Mesorhizobium sp. Z1-4 TaxID=2448478 RepID=UPI001FDEF5F1|nr:hypothetical protein [Mesorhizobium sp. Z1-4]
MIKGYIDVKSTVGAAFGAVMMCAGISASAHAEWFAHLDSADRLIITGVATNNDGLLSALMLTCVGGRLVAEISTQHNADSDDLPFYTGTKVVLGYKTREGAPRKMGLDGTPVVLPGGILGIVVALSDEQSEAIYTSIGRGNRLDVELVHPELIYDVGVKKVYSGGFTTAFLAMHDHCSGLTER